jgi:hypothetical protein
MTTIHNAMGTVLDLMKKLAELNIDSDAYAGLMSDLTLEFYVITSELKGILMQNEELRNQIEELVNDRV